MASNATEVLAGFAATVTYEKIPERVRKRCKDLLLDTLACALAGHQGEETHQSTDEDPQQTRRVAPEE